jgi:hypothetical protein
MLTTWFNLNSVVQEANETTHIQITEHYVICRQSRQWKNRIFKKKTIGKLPILYIGHDKKLHL